MGLLDALRLPECREIQDLDAPETTLLHREIILKKPLLKSLYQDFYRRFREAVPGIEHKTCVELGSGGGFIKDVLPKVQTSDVLKLPGLDHCFSALCMPFTDSSVDAFFMIDVFHHVPDARLFLKNMARCLKQGGKIVMVEPANTAWGRFIYTHFHHEGFDPKAGWTLPPGGPLSTANGALPWIVFERDLEQFQHEFPELRLLGRTAHTPLRYLVSGGLTLRQILPGFMDRPLQWLEWVLSPLNPCLGLFMTIQLEKVPDPS